MIKSPSNVMQYPFNIQHIHIGMHKARLYLSILPFQFVEFYLVCIDYSSEY